MFLVPEYFINDLNDGIDLYREVTLKGEQHKVRNMQWATEVDCIVIGGCSRILKDDVIESILKELEHPQVKRGNESATILVISECCGQYNDEQQKRLRDARPDLEFLFPVHHDFKEAFDLTRGHGHIAYMLSVHLRRAEIVSPTSD